MAVLVHSEMLYLKSRARLHMQRRLKTNFVSAAGSKPYSYCMSVWDMTILLPLDLALTPVPSVIRSDIPLACYCRSVDNQSPHLFSIDRPVYVYFMILNLSCVQWMIRAVSQVFL